MALHEKGEGAESYSVRQIRQAFSKHSSTDDWGVRNFYEDGLIAALRGEYDPEPDPGCTCGANLYGPLAEHLTHCEVLG